MTVSRLTLPKAFASNKNRRLESFAWHCKRVVVQVDVSRARSMDCLEQDSRDVGWAGVYPIGDGKRGGVVHTEEAPRFNKEKTSHNRKVMELNYDKIRYKKNLTYIARHLVRL